VRRPRQRACRIGSNAPRAADEPEAGRLVRAALTDGVTQEAADQARMLCDVMDVTAAPAS